MSPLPQDDAEQTFASSDPLQMPTLTDIISPSRILPCCTVETNIPVCLDTKGAAGSPEQLTERDDGGGHLILLIQVLPHARDLPQRGQPGCLNPIGGSPCQG